MLKIFATKHGRHLTAEEIDGVLHASLKTPPESTAHLRACPACAGEVAAMREALGLFRQALSGAAEAEVKRWEPAAPALLWTRDRRERKTFRPLPAYFALAASLALAVVLIPLERPMARPVAAPAVETTTAHAASPATLAADDALLEEIDQQVSASVPTALEPLENPADASDASAIAGSTGSTADKRN